MRLRSGKIISYKPKQRVKKDKKMLELCNLFKKVELRDEIDDLILSINKTKISINKKNKHIKKKYLF